MNTFDKTNYVTITEAAKMLGLSRYMVSAAKRYAKINPRRHKFPLKAIEDALNDPGFSAIEVTRQSPRRQTQDR